MDTPARIIEAASAIRRIWERHRIKESFRLSVFYLTLLPIPLIPQAAQIIDRHLQDAALAKELDEIWQQLKQANAKVSKVETLEEAIQEIAATLNARPDLDAIARQFVHKLGEFQKEFSMVTEKGSYQSIFNSLVSTEVAQFIARQGSRNAIEGSTIRAEKTVLHATDQSQQHINGSKFVGLGGEIGMQGITAQGAILVQGNSIGFGTGGSINFGGDPFLVRVNCPHCNTSIELDYRKMKGDSQLLCPQCKGTFP